MTELNRRDFAKGTVESLVTYSLLSTLFNNELFGSEIKPVMTNGSKTFMNLDRI